MTSGISIFSTANRADVAIYPHDVFAVTEEGMREIQSGTPTRLPARALEVLVMLDGESTVGDLEQRMAHISAEKLRNLLRSLLDVQLIRVTLPQTSTIEVDFDAFFKAASSPYPASSGAAKSADREAVKGAPQLQRKGYYVSIARKAVRTRAPAAGAKLRVLTVDDDPDLTALVKRLLEREGFAVATCATRDSIVSHLRATLLPDLVMLDVAMPDVNGFDVLQRMKAHPHLKAIPVVMVTADAKRESVMRGLALGADGYITKPFDHKTLVKGVKAVLGL